MNLNKIALVAGLVISEISFNSGFSSGNAITLTCYLRNIVLTNYYIFPYAENAKGGNST